MVRRLTKEQAEHYARHLRIHVDELRTGNLNKNPDYVDYLAQARIIFLESAHDIIYILREKRYQGYENADFEFSITIEEEDVLKHQFSIFDVASYRVMQKIRYLLEFQEAKDIPLSVEEVESQMNIIGQTIIDLSYGILLFQRHFGDTREFLIPQI